MLFFKKKVKRLRLELRKNMRSSAASLWQRFRDVGGVGSVLLVGLFYVAVLAMDIYPPDPLPYRLGQYIPADIHSRVAFKTELPEGSYRAGEVLVWASRTEGTDGGKIGPLSEGKLYLLRAEHQAFLDAERRTNPWRRWGRIVGRAGVLLLLIAAMGWYVVKYRPRLVANHWRGFAIIVFLLLMLGISKAMVHGMGWNPHAAVLTVVMTSVVMTIAYDHRFAVVLSLTLGVLTVLQMRAGLEMLIVLLAGAVAGTVWLGEIRSRTRLIEVAGIAAGIVLVAVLGIGMAKTTPLWFLLSDGAWAAGATLLVGFLIQGILPVIERIFLVATSMTLLEWCDASRPLLKRLAMEAPGTYNHSLQLGAMCEAAAEAIGARGLLARVGACYHDIGKINKPSYFVENKELGTASKHDKLSPAMSMLIIMGHVKDGLVMAREYGLPRVLHEFIATHHGTTLVQYFYHVATEQKKSQTDRAPDETDFRYPGPKPASREAAILLLADASESSVRAMSDPTPARIENQVRTMVSRRLMDGQLDRCEMTLNNVHIVEGSLIKSLCSIYHSRMSYPAPPGEEPSASEEGATNKE